MAEERDGDRPTVVVFDLGNVLVVWDRRFLFEKLIDDPDELDRFLDEVYTLDENAVLDRGTPLGEMCADLAARHPEHAALFEVFEDRWIETIGPVMDDTVAVLDELVDAGVPCYALSNWGADTFEVARPRLTFLDRFDGVVISGRERVVKPEPEIFDILCRRHGIEPASTVFIDDSEANVATARDLGFEAILFDDADELRRHPSIDALLRAG